MRDQDVGTADDEAQFEETLTCFGLQLDTPEADSALPEAVCYVHPNHVPALHLFLACQSQWALHLGMGGAHWRSAASVNVAQELHWLGIERSQRAALVQQYRLMEQEALSILNEREAQAART